MDKERKLKIEDWAQKGAEWCATQLWNARKALSDERDKSKRYYLERNHARAERNVNDHILKQSNEIMARVLADNGIRPTRLRITYLDCDCFHCPNNGNIYGEDAWDCAGCGEEINGEIWREREVEVTESLAFYTYTISGGYLRGITSLFEEKEYDLLKIVDERTGEVIGEWETVKDKECSE